MISLSDNPVSSNLSDQLYSVFIDTRQEISTLAVNAPGNMVEAVHLIRKRLKFLRAFVKLVQFNTNNDYKDVNVILRDSGRLISDCRDAHVRTILLDEMTQDKSPLPMIEEFKKTNFKETQRVENELLKNDIFNRVVSNLTEKKLIDYFSGLENDLDSLLSGFCRCYEKSYHAFHYELISHEADLLHEWRKRTKDLQYQLEVLHQILPDELSVSLIEVSELCEILGQINDLNMFLDWTNDLKQPLSNGENLSDLRDEVFFSLQALEDEADKRGEHLYKLTPEKYEEKLTEQIQ